MTNPRDGRQAFTGRWQWACSAVAFTVLCAGLIPACGDDASGGIDGGTEGGSGGEGGDGDGGINVDGGNTPDATPDATPDDGGDSGACAPPKAMCGTTCLDTKSDVLNCGGCDVKCATTNGVPACVGGVCTVGSCNVGFADCDTNPANGCEVATNTDPTQCGACGNACNPTNGVPACVAGKCTIATCNGGFADCDKNATNGCEVNVGTDPLQCGACGAACSTANGVPSCAGGTCTLLSCAPGFADCDSLVPNGCEVNTSNNPLQCGACNHACVEANATAGCAAGKCTVATCNAGFADCNKSAADGCEINVNTAPANCGACGTICAAANGVPGCTAGACTVTSCNPGFGDCDGNPANGCEVNTNTTPTSCGACGTVCALPNATAGCAAGTCTVGTCNAGFADCDGNPANGCEVNTQTTPTSCGTCGNVCAVPNAAAGCAAGVCTVGTCNAGFADCDGNAANGCEVNTQTTPTSCGACGNVCALPNATAGCAAGACTVAACSAGFADCDGNAANGCETNTLVSPTSCGACGNVCALPNATAGCAAGMCTVATCNAGFADCNVNPADGCETNTQATVGSCGACGNVCTTSNGTPSCVAGACAIASCNAGFADCDGNPANGCEVNTQNTVTSCGTCGNVCTTSNGTPSCVAGACAVASCNAGFGDCDGNPANGCEVNIQNSLTNCGVCGKVCTTANGTPTCSAGTCAIASCDPGFASCDGLIANGCETNTTIDAANCGACGNACATACGGAPKFVSTAACQASTCNITACTAGHGDNDLTCSNGCECPFSTTSSTCAAATNLGTMVLGQTITQSSNLYPAAVGAAYYTVTFTGNGSTAYAPSVTISDPLNEFVIDILSTCGGGTLTCGNEGGGSTGVTMWSEAWIGGGYNNPIPPVGNGGNVIIKVYRKVPMTSCTNAYTLKITN